MNLTTRWGQELHFISHRDRPFVGSSSESPYLRGTDWRLRGDLGANGGVFRDSSYR